MSHKNYCMFYFIKTPGWLKKIYPSCTWHISTSKKVIYLSFDDGPHPVATPFILEQLNKYNAKATFFCIGKNVVAHQQIFNKIIEGGHAVGNHTFNHLNGWKTKKSDYIENVENAGKIIASNLFRPPYGKITRPQIKYLTGQPKPYKIIMWSVLSADFDAAFSKEQCLGNVLKNTGSGSIVVFHDSDKAWEKLRFALPKVLEMYTQQGFTFEKIV